MSDASSTICMRLQQLTIFRLTGRVIPVDQLRRVHPQEGILSRMASSLDKIYYCVSLFTACISPNGSPLSKAPDQLLACIDSLGVMCEASPPLLAPHIDTLLLYLKGENGLDNRHESIVCRQVADIVYQTLPLLDKPDLVQMAELAKDLTNLAYRFGSVVVHSSLRCLARLVQLVTQDPTPILDLLQSFYSALFRHRGETQKETTVDSRVRHRLLRGLVVAGSICRFYSFGSGGEDERLGKGEEETDDGRDRDKFEHNDGGRAGGLTAGDSDHDGNVGDRWNGQRQEGVSQLPAKVTLKGARVEVFSMLCFYFCEARGQDLRSKALQGLGQLLIGSPRLTLLADKRGVVGAALSKGAGNAVLAQALRCWKDILSAEEERVETGLAMDDMAATGVTVAQKVQGDQDAESSVVGGVLQMHLSAILSLFFHRATPVRSAAVSLLGVMLRQGLVNPVDVVPQLLALAGDSDQSVRTEAVRLLTVQDSKQGDFIRTRLLDGLFMAYTFQRQVLRDFRPSLPSTDPAAGGRGGGSIVGPAYTLCVRPNRQTRYSCLRQMVALFTEGKAGEVQSILHSTRQKVGVLDETLDGDSGDNRRSGPGVSSTSPYAKPASVSSRSGSFSGNVVKPLDICALSFLCCTLAGLPYEVQEEPLFVVDCIDRQMSLQGTLCLEFLHTLLGRHGVQTPTPDGDGIGDSDDNVTEASRRAPPVEAKEEARVSATGSRASESMSGPPRAQGSVAQLRRLSSAALSFSMLLRLRRYLKGAYGLRDTKCSSFRPHEATKAMERQAQLPDPAADTFSPFSEKAQGRERGGESGQNPAEIALAARERADKLTSGTPQELSCFYVELRALARHDSSEYTSLEDMLTVDGRYDEGRAGSQQVQKAGSKKRRSSTGATSSSASKAKRLAANARTIGKETTTSSKKRRRHSSGMAVLSASSDDEHLDEGGDDKPTTGGAHSL